MGRLRWAVVVLALIEGGWMAFDGGRALVVGEYVTPKTGKHAGQLGPWTRCVEAVGIDPESTLMKSIFLTYGVVWIGVAACFAAGASWAWWAMLALAVGSLLYLAVGTGFGVLQIMLLIIPGVRRASS